MKLKLIATQHKKFIICIYFTEINWVFGVQQYQFESLDELANLQQCNRNPLWTYNIRMHKQLLRKYISDEIFFILPSVLGRVSLKD